MLLRKYENQASFRCFYRRQSVTISVGTTKDVRIGNVSKSLATWLLGTTGFIEIP